MDGTWFAGRMAAARRRARSVHTGGLPAQQRLHFAAFLILLLCGASAYAQDIKFNPAISAEQFQQFSRLVAQGIFPTPVQPARASGVLGFDIGVAATGIKVDTAAPYWKNSVANDFTTAGGYVAVPRLVASKGFSAGTISASYAKVNSSDIKTYGGAIDIPVIRGSIATPEVALRGSYATVTGATDYNLKVYGVEAFISKGIGPVTPYGAIGRMRSNATGTAWRPTTLLPDPIHLSDTSNVNRFTAGVRLSLLVPKIAVEVTKAEVTSYAAKVSFGF